MLSTESFVIHKRLLSCEYNDTVCRQPTHLNYTYSLYVIVCLSIYLCKTSDPINIILDLIQSISSLLGNI